MESTNYTNYTKEIIKSLLDIGVPASLKGYECLKVAINAVLNDRTYLSQITKRLYPDVAEVCGTTPSRVERAIRHAITVSFDNMDPNMVERYFGRCCSYRSGKVTNATFIAIVAEHIRMDNGEYDGTSKERVGK